MLGAIGNKIQAGYLHSLLIHGILRLSSGRNRDGCVHGWSIAFRKCSKGTYMKIRAFHLKGNSKATKAHLPTEWEEWEAWKQAVVPPRCSLERMLW
jgi:hypothetical protein